MSDDYNFIPFKLVKADHTDTPYLTIPSFIQDDNTVRAYKICQGDIIEYTLSEFLKPLNINMMMNNKFEVIGYGKRKDYWMLKLFGKLRRINKPFCWIKTVKLRYIGD